MARRGRPRTPTPVLIARGTFRRDRHGDRADAPQPAGAGELTEGQRQLLDATPAWLPREARSTYVDCVRAAHWLMALDLPLLLAFVDACERHRVASAELGKRLKDPAFANPKSEVARTGLAYSKIVHGAASTILQLSDDLLFNPVARQKAGVTVDRPKPRPKDDAWNVLALKVVPKDPPDPGA